MRISPGPEPRLAFRWRRPLSQRLAQEHHPVAIDPLLERSQRSRFAASYAPCSEGVRRRCRTGSFHGEHADAQGAQERDHGNGIRQVLAIAVK